MLDVSSYIGIPFADRGRDRRGCDCWGLVRLIMAERFGLDLPSYDAAYPTANDRRAVASHIAAVMPEWVDVETGQERPGDVVILSLLGRPLHVGMVVEAGRMIHIEAGLDACLESYRGPHCGRRVLGIVRPK